MTASALFAGRVRHRRLGDVPRVIEHPITLAYLDLEELPRLLGGTLVRRFPGLVRVRRRDLLEAGDGLPTAAAVRALVGERTGRPAPEGPVRVLTSPRILGTAFNPVSFYYCFDRSEQLDAVVAEVTNTPWGDKHAYVLRADTPGAPVLRGRDAKQLHVSPFQPMAREHVWSVTPPGQTLSVHIQNEDADGAVDFDATLKLERRPLAVAPLVRAQPGGALRTLGLIYGHAVATKLRGATHFAPPADPNSEPQRMTRSQTLARRAVLALLRTMKVGRLEIAEPNGKRVLLGPGGEPYGVIEVADPQFWVAMLRGSRGLATSYASKYWESPDVVGVVRVAARNVQALDEVRRRVGFLRVPYQELSGIRDRNTHESSRDDIHRHYDLGNDLFELMLDETMMYSAGAFATPETSLRDAQLAKLELVCDKLSLGPDDHVLEIGTGWGGFAVHAATTRGCRVTTTTISQEQHDYAVERVRTAGVEDLVTVLLEDYRDLGGTYSRVVSLEMIEAVGWQDFGTFFGRCSDLLAEDGAMLLQAITMDDRAYEVEKASKSFIREFIFPNGCLPSQEVIARCLSHHTDFRMAHHEDLTGDYAITLAHWRERTDAAAEQLEALGYDERFRRLWRMYLCYCEGGFAERRIAVGQTLLAKPGWRGRVPSTVIAGPGGMSAPSEHSEHGRAQVSAQ